MGTAAMKVTGVGQRVYSANVQSELAVADCHWSADTAAEFGSDAICRHEVAATSFQATMDGIGFEAAWHRGAEAGTVYAERYEGGVCVWHGWVDSESRKIVQAG